MMIINAMKPRTPKRMPNIVAYGGPELPSSDEDGTGFVSDVLVCDVVDVEVSVESVEGVMELPVGDVPYKLSSDECESEGSLDVWSCELLDGSGSDSESELLVGLGATVVGPLSVVDGPEAVASSSVPWSAEDVVVGGAFVVEGGSVARGWRGTFVHLRPW
ncbi:hypothetical protein BJY01DRAFT_229487 [Aspergillus pseudoustus]|uniref:Uncharacterized protein n=1 Tax=Aspergillus pseudoustus TaxID=1810923 RepID=A0ABR4IJD4_9EURO